MVEAEGPKDKSVQCTATWTDVHQMAEKYDVFILDQDGVIWQGNNQIGEAFKVIEWLEEQGKKVYFVTNNAAKTQ